MYVDAIQSQSSKYSDDNSQDNDTIELNDDDEVPIEIESCEDSDSSEDEIELPVIQEASIQKKNHCLSSITEISYDLSSIS